MRLIGDAAARVVADRARRQPGAQTGRQVPRRAIIPGDDQRRNGGVGRRATPRRGTSSEIDTNARPPSRWRAAVCGS